MIKLWAEPHFSVSPAAGKDIITARNSELNQASSRWCKRNCY